MESDAKPELTGAQGSGVRPPGAIVKHSLAVAGHRTSISLEQAFWDALKAVAAARNQPVAALVAEIDAARGEANLSSAIRVFVLQRGRGQACP
jgi:predicted DNA-binding ribbon-helix-helix protein